VSRGIEQVAQVVQTTSATAEESAAASEELSGQAEYLKEMVGRFTLADGGAAGQPQRKPASRRAISDGGRAKPRIKMDDTEFGKY
jgi:methyl-accepting chemotaxis protein